MKKIIVSILACVTLLNAYAEEGMWLPIMLKQLEANMKSQGLKLSAEAIYDVNQNSLKDAVVLFGGGCTGEIISKQSLLLTNHHCGFSAIAALSTIENDYLKNGYWAYNTSQELPAPGVTATFIIRIEDVTSQIQPYLTEGMTEAERNSKIKSLVTEIEKKAIAGTHYEASVKPFYNGNDFILFVSETFKDLRLVGTPPNAIGNFGEETDNWVWPRHTGDFSLFRIYAGADNKPATYSKNNVPFVPRKHLQISTKGIAEGDFTMVYGFPGRTQQYLPSDGVQLIQEIQNPNRVAIRKERIAITEKYMEGNDTITLAYAPKIRSLANYYKKWSGEMLGLRKNNVVEKKRSQESNFQYWATMNPSGQPYTKLLSDFKAAYAQYKPLANGVDYTNEAVWGIEIMNYAKQYNRLVALSFIDTIPDSILTAEANKILKNSKPWFDNYRIAIDKEVFAALLKMYGDSVQAAYRPEYFNKMEKHYKGNYVQWSNDVFKKSFMTNYTSVEKMLSNYKRNNAKKVTNDLAFQLMQSINENYENVLSKKASAINQQIAVLQRKYMQAQRLQNSDKLLYPDCNSTLRVTYGKVKGYTPRNGVYYNYQTWLNGVIEKNITGNPDYVMPTKLRQLIESKDFGPYAVNGDVPVSFVATNHTTGGNSGSPVLNANGQLIGTNYDRVWEGTMSDVYYDANICRNITLDVRYTLFIIDKYAGATNIMNELDIVSQ